MMENQDIEDCPEMLVGMDDQVDLAQLALMEMPDPGVYLAVLDLRDSLGKMGNL